MALLITLVGLIVALLVCGLLYKIYKIIVDRKKYEHIPGPPVDNFFLGVIPTFRRYGREGKFLNEMTLDWAKVYGHLYKMFFADKVFLVTTDPQAVRELLVTGNHKKPKITYAPLTKLYGVRFLGKGLVVETDQKVWVWRRALMNPCFMRSYIKGFETALNSEADILMTRLTRMADGKTMLSMSDEFNHLTLDIIGKIAFGMEMDNFENRTEKSDFTRAITLTFQGLSQSLKEPLNILKPSKWKFIREVKKAAKFLRVFSRQCFRNRMKALQNGDYTPDDILNHLVKMKLENPDFDEEVILDDITTFFVAGQETTANLLSFAMICLWQNKDVYQKLREEVNEVVGVKPFISYDDVNKMTYMDMVIKETLRLYPPGANTFRETTHDIEVCGYKVPKGSIFSVSTFVSSRLEEFFPEPLKFDPERFNPNAPEKVQSYTYFPFTLGPRTCIGKNFAEVEAKIILTKIMQRFNFEMDPDQSFDIIEETTLKPKGGVKCTLTLNDSFDT